MKIIKVDTNNQVNGDGLRCVIWVSGCIHNCKGCHNPETHDYNFGHDITDEERNIILQQLLSEEISGVTLTGGDPFFTLNQAGLVELCKWIKQVAPLKNIWCYTGHCYEEIKHTELIEYIDVLIDGKYDEAQNWGPGKHLWRGSENQRIIDVQQTRWTGVFKLLYNEKEEEN